MVEVIEKGKKEVDQSFHEVTKSMSEVSVLSGENLVARRKSCPDPNGVRSNGLSKVLKDYAFSILEEAPDIPAGVLAGRLEVKVDLAEELIKAFRERTQKRSLARAPKPEASM